MPSSHKGKRGNQPLVPPPNKVMSRKRARVVTTQFHKLTRLREAAVQANDAAQVQALDAQIQAMGGRKEYQRASQTSTSFHSTSKWVLGYLSRCGWLYGIPLESSSTKENTDQSTRTARHTAQTKRERRPTKILEVGAINTELLDAAISRKVTDDNGDHDDISDNDNNKKKTMNRLDVRAIDLHAMDRRIEKADFLQLPVSHRDVHQRYDVIVCSMVLNCVPTAQQRGEMLCRLYHFLRPDGLLFLTIPRTCLALSPYMDKNRFMALLRAIGFVIPENKESPKIAFFICQRKDRMEPSETNNNSTLDPKWTTMPRIHGGKKFTNDFAIVVQESSFRGETLSFPTP